MLRTVTAILLTGLLAAPALAQSTAPAPAARPGPFPAPAAPASPATPAPATPGNASAGQFSTETAAKAHCPGDAIVWVNLGGSKAYHAAGTKYYGKTKHGAYMCQKEASQSGFHAAGSHAAAKKQG